MVQQTPSAGNPRRPTTPHQPSALDRARQTVVFAALHGRARCYEPLLDEVKERGLTRANLDRALDQLAEAGRVVLLGSGGPAGVMVQPIDWDDDAGAARQGQEGRQL